MTPRVVCFDLGGVVIRLSRDWRACCAVAQLPFRDVLDQKTSPHERRALRALVDTYQRGEIDCDTYAIRLARHFDDAYAPEDMLAIHRGMIAGEYEGVGAIMDALRARGVTVAGLSNVNHSHWLQVQPITTLAKINPLVTSHLVGAVKPSAEAYRAVEAQTHARGQEILFFDDTPENIEAARDLGWRAETIDPRRETAPQIHGWLGEHGLVEATALSR